MLIHKRKKNKSVYLQHTCSFISHVFSCHLEVFWYFFFESFPQELVPVNVKSKVKYKTLHIRYPQIPISDVLITRELLM